MRFPRRNPIKHPLTLGCCAVLVFSVAAIALSGTGRDAAAAVWGACTNEDMRVAETGYPLIDFFSGGGSYMARTQCMVTQEGETDWAWVWGLVGLNALVIAGYLRIFVFWRRAYLQEEEQDRNKKQMELAWIFLFCAACGYVSSIMLFFWPAYRLLALMLVPLAFFTWKFASNLEDFRVSLSAKRLSRQLNESLHLQNERLMAQVAAATADLERARDDAQRASAAKSEFLARMSHEIRTPMSSILGYVEIALEPGTPDREREESLGTVQRNSEHLLHLINDVLDVSKIEAGEMSYERVTVSPRRLVDDVVALMQPKAELKGIALGSDVDPGLPDLVVTDPTRVRQLLTNLVGNAVKFTDKGSVCVEAAARREGDAWALELRVRDTGIGMTPEQSRRVFDSFAQAAGDTTRRYGGTGLGLTISRRIARDLGGDLRAESVHNAGSTFTATLMCGIAHESVNDEAPTNAETVPGDGVELAGRRVLLVEDGEDNSRLIRHHFRKAGVELERAADGVLGVAAAHDAINNGEPHELVLMDINMPNMDGIEATRRLERLGSRHRS